MKGGHFLHWMASTLHIFICLSAVQDHDYLQASGSFLSDESSSTVSGPFRLKVINSCGQWTNISWTVQTPVVHLDLLTCELTFYRPGQQNSQIIDIFLDPHSHIITLLNLSLGERYDAFMVCNGYSRTNDVTFIAGSLCEVHQFESKNHSTDLSDDGNKPVVSSYPRSRNYDEWPVAIIFAVVAIAICAVVAFYMWKKYQRRQRILRIFRQGQSDSFQALYIPTQDSYSL